LLANWCWCVSIYTCVRPLRQCSSAQHISNLDQRNDHEQMLMKVFVVKPVSGGTPIKPKLEGCHILHCVVACIHDNSANIPNWWWKQQGALYLTACKKLSTQYCIREKKSNDFSFSNWLWLL
jgi:hypothetical protein